MILNWFWKLKGTVLLSILILFFSISFSFAQTDISIGVSPTSKSLVLSQGETYSDEIVFWNLAQTPENYLIFVSGFRQIGNQPGTAIILTPEEDAEALYSASKWITVEKDSIFLEPNVNTKLQYSITVPADATDGEFYAEIFLISEGDFANMGTSAFTTLGSGMPILIQIGDDYVENAELLRFVADKKVYEQIDITFLTTLKNLGSTHIKPTGEIIIENIFRQEVARIPFNQSGKSLLRDNTGNYDDNWKLSGYLSPSKSIALGPMTARIIITYRTFQPGFSVLNAQTTFWVIPWKIILIIIAIIILYSIIRNRKRKLEKKNEIH